MYWMIFLLLCFSNLSNGNKRMEIQFDNMTIWKNKLHLLSNHLKFTPW